MPRSLRTELWVWIEKNGEHLQSSFLEAAEQVPVTLKSNPIQNLKDRFRVRFDQLFFVMEKKNNNTTTTRNNEELEAEVHGLDLLYYFN